MSRAICIWPDGSWCDRSAVEHYTWRGDDYTTREVSDEWDDTRIDVYALGIA